MPALVQITDSFARPAGILLGQVADTGQTWVSGPGPVGGALATNGSQAYSPAGGGAVQWIDTGVEDGTVSVVLGHTTPGTAWPALYVRCAPGVSGTGGFYRIETNGSTVYLERDTTVMTSWPITLNTGDRLGLRAEAVTVDAAAATQLTVYRNGATVGTYTVTDPALQRHGTLVGLGSGFPGAVFDDFDFTSLALAPEVPPYAPTGLAQVGGTSSTVVVEWAAPTTGTPPTGYDVRVDGGTPTALGLVTSRTLTGLAPATAYTVEVRSSSAYGPSAWVGVTASTTAVPPTPSPGDYGTHLRVGTHEWDVTTGTADYGPLAGLRFTWDARQDDGWPTQHNPTVLVFGVIVEAGTDFSDVDQGTPVHFTFTPAEWEHPLLEFGGTVRDLVARPHARGMVYEVTAVDYLQALKEDRAAVSIAANGPMSGPDGLWARATSDTDGYGPRPWFPDPFTGDVRPADFPGATNGPVPLVMSGTAWDVLGGILGGFIHKPGSTVRAHRGVLSYRLDGAGDLDATQPYVGTWVPRPSTAAPRALDGRLLATAGTAWSRPRIEPNVVVLIDPDLGELAPVERPHTGVDVVRYMNLPESTYVGFTDPLWITAGVESPDQWSTTLTLLASRDPEGVADWFTLPTAMTTYVECSGIDPRHTPTGSGELAGMLGGASLVIPPGGDWFVQFTLRKTLPDPG